MSAGCTATSISVVVCVPTRVSAVVLLVHLDSDISFWPFSCVYTSGSGAILADFFQEPT